jgi:hypothetical protein
MIDLGLLQIDVLLRLEAPRRQGREAHKVLLGTDQLGLIVGLAGSALAVVVFGLASVLFRCRGFDAITGWAAAVFAVGAVSYLVVLMVASVTTAARDGWDLLPILPATFARYHLGYGVGFLQGLIDFVVRRRTAPSARMSQLTR